MSRHDDDGLEHLPAWNESLARGVPPSAPGSLFALGLAGGIAIRPREGRTVLFGRNRLDVHVCVGADDRRVSRQHGELIHARRQWWVRNTGRSPLQLPDSRLLFSHEDPVPLTTGYTPLFVRGSRRREHLLELYVTEAGDGRPPVRHRDVTEPPTVWRLDPGERLVLVVLGQRYLRHDSRAQPLTWQDTARQLTRLCPLAKWTPKRVEHLVCSVRTRLSARGVAGLTREEVGEPVGNALNDNLIRELLLSTTLVPPHLALLDDPDDLPLASTG